MKIIVDEVVYDVVKEKDINGRQKNDIKHTVFYSLDSISIYSCKMMAHTTTDTQMSR